MTPYRENFERLLDDKSFKKEVVLFSIDEEATVVDEGDAIPDDQGAMTDEGPSEEEEDEEKPLKPSTDADTYLLFTKPNSMGSYILN